jgi:hypothetical protein
MNEQKKEDLQPYEKVNKLSKKEIILNNFIGGISWALGATIGLSLVITLLTLIAKNVNFVPIFGKFISDILNFVLATNPNFNR